MQLRNVVPSVSRPSQNDETGVCSQPPMLMPASGSAATATHRRAGWLDAALFFCLSAFALCAPLATKGAVTAFRAAMLVWLVKILVDGRKFHRQPLALPLLLFLLFTGASTIFSSEPLLSWGRMRGITDLTIAILIGQNLKNLRHVKILVGLLFASCLVSVGITAWQYTVGIGVQLNADDQGAIALSQFGLFPGDVVQKVAGHPVHTPPQLFGRLDGLPTDSTVEFTVARGAPMTRMQMAIGRKDALEGALKHRGVALIRGRPLRAQGTLKHYFPYSEVMVLIALVAWGLLVAPGASIRLKVTLGLTFLSIATVVVLTLTRISLASLLFGCFLISWKDSSRKARRVISVAFFLVLLLSLNWVQTHRAQKWLDLSDPGNQYRLLMWRDSLKFIRAHPLFGVGLDSVVGHWQRWDLEAYRRYPLRSHFHSTPVQIAVECGLPALAAWLWLMGGYFRYLLRLSTVSKNRGWFPHGLASGILGGLVAVLLTSTLQYNFGDAESMIVFWFLMGLAFSLHSIVLDENRTLPATVRVEAR
jgi:branched-subunit amino acid transport protein